MLLLLEVAYLALFSLSLLFLLENACVLRDSRHDKERPDENVLGPPRAKFGPWARN